MFAREPDYDTNLDPVVRTTAAEIRKRLAQFYQDPEHEADLRIDLPLGSYAARFQAPIEKAAPPPMIEICGAPLNDPGLAVRPRRALRVLALVGISVLVILFAWIKLWPPHSALDRLWSPVLESSSPVLLCVGQRPFAGLYPNEPKSVPVPAQFSATPQTTLFQLYYLGSQNVALPDVMTLGRLAGLLQAKGKAFHIRGEAPPILRTCAMGRWSSSGRLITIGACG